MCGNVLSRELFLSGIMIFSAKVKMHNALMNFLNASIYGSANCSGLSELHLNFKFSVNAMLLMRKGKHTIKAYFYFKIKSCLKNL